MTDWLSEIEDKVKLCQSLARFYGITTAEAERMSRVLRELADVVKMIGIPPHYAPDVVGQAIRIRGALNNLPDDAKELCVVADESAKNPG